MKIQFPLNLGVDRNYPEACMVLVGFQDDQQHRKELPLDENGDEIGSRGQLTVVLKVYTSEESLNAGERSIRHPDPLKTKYVVNGDTYQNVVVKCYTNQDNLMVRMRNFLKGRE